MLIPVTEASQAGEARRRARAFAEELEMTEDQCGRVALVATEMATNLVKHAGRGQILVQRMLKNGHAGIRIISIDKGPGIADVAKALSDGHSTAGSMGSGLGAIRRVPDAFELYSIPGSGTVISAEFWSDASMPLSARQIPLRVDVISEPIHGEEVCGDGWGAHAAAGGLVLMVVDGLGHGVLAAEAAREAERVLALSKNASLKEIIEDSHGALRKTRGAALAVARVNFETNTLTYAGIGNICASLIDKSGASRSLASHNGTVGGHFGRLQEFVYPWHSDSMLVMHSDGLASRWDLAKYPGIWNRPPSVVAALLHRDFSRERDDTTVLVAKAA